MTILRPGAPLAAWQAWPRVGGQWPKYNIESDQANGLVAWWPSLAGLSGTLYDLIGAFNGVLSGATWRFDRDFGQILDFSGATTDMVDVPHYPQLDVVGDLTISAWIWTADLNQTNAVGIILTKEAAAGVADSPYQLAVKDNTGALRFVQVLSSGVDILDSTDSISISSWHHVVVQRDVASTDITFWFNAVQDSGGWQNYTNGAGPSNPASGVRIGRHNTNNRDWNGYIADLRVQNRLVSPPDIFAQYDLVTRWDLYQIPRRVWAFEAAAARRIFITHC